MRNLISRIKQDVAWNLEVLRYEQQPEAIVRSQRVREYVFVTLEHAKYGLGAVICKFFGHHKNTQVEEFMDCEYAEVPDDGLPHKPKVTDINGGGVDWLCPRCGRGGRSRF